MSAARFTRRVHRASDEALRTLEWHDLAAYIDSLHEEWQRFLTLINERRIGHHVPPPRLKMLRGTTTPEASPESDPVVKP